ncbi:MAG: MCE family protein [Thermoflavifilum aggregans]|nr:MCE family protein [Thermoflavifilum aggregans]
MKISNETKIGALTVVSVTLLIIGFNVLKGSNLFGSGRNLYVKYHDVQGLNISSPVVVNGLLVGRVTGMQLSPREPDVVIVKLNLSKNVHIPVNSKASIYSPDLLSPKSIRIDLGDAPQWLKNGDTLQSAPPSSLTGELTRQLSPLSLQLQHTLAEVDTVLLDVHALLSPATRQDLQASIASLKNTLAHLDVATAQTRQIMQQVNQFVTRLTSQQDTLHAILANTQQLTGELAAVHWQQLTDQLNHSLNDLQQILDKINRGQGSLGALLNNPQLYHNLEQSTANLNRLLEDLRLNPHRYVHFSIFGGRQKIQPLTPDTIYMITPSSDHP